MSTIRERLSPATIRALEAVPQGTAASTAQRPPELHQATAVAVSQWTEELKKGTPLHLTQAMLNSISDPELRAEVVMAALAQDMRQAHLGITPSPDRSPFTASSMSEALKRVLKLRTDDITTDYTFRKEGEAMTEFVRLLERLAADLNTANSDTGGHEVRFGASKSVKVVWENGQSSFRSQATLAQDARGEWTVGSADQNNSYFTPQLKSVRTSSLVTIRQSLLELLGDGTAKPSHPGLAALGGDLGGSHVRYQQALTAVDDAIKFRADQVEARERELTKLLARAIIGEPIAKVETPAATTPPPSPTVGRTDRTWLSTLIEMLKPHGWDGV